MFTLGAGSPPKAFQLFLWRCVSAGALETSAAICCFPQPGTVNHSEQHLDFISETTYTHTVFRAQCKLCYRPAFPLLLPVSLLSFHLISFHSGKCYSFQLLILCVPFQKRWKLLFLFSTRDWPQNIYNNGHNSADINSL